MTGRFSLSLRRFAIERNGAAAHEPLRGRGTVRQTPEGRLHFSFRGRVEFPLVHWWGPAGRARKANEMPTLVGIDSSGREWRGGQVALHNIATNIPHTNRGTASGAIQELSCCSAATPESPQLRLLIPGKHRTPLATWRFADAPATFCVINHGEHLEVLVSSPSELPGDLDLRIQEAFWFVLGSQSLAIVVQRTRDQVLETSVYSQPVVCVQAADVLLHPQISNKDSLADIIVRYVHYSREGLPEEFHPTSGHIRRVRTAATIEQEVLAVCVAIEAFVRREHATRGEPSEDTIRSVNEIEAHIESWNGDLDTKKRVLGCVRRIRAKDARSAIHELARDGPLTTLHSAAWERTRHISAHGSLPRDRLQQVIEDRPLLSQAMEFLILDRIGYKGPVSDRATLGWPTVSFPRSNAPPPTRDNLDHTDVSSVRK
jgi:hypothetical protein